MSQSRPDGRVNFSPESEVTMFGKYGKLVDADAPTMKGNVALKMHPDAIINAFTGDPQAQLVHVSGSGPNVFGHTLLCFDVDDGFYVHVHRAGKHKPDVICGHAAFSAYLSEEGKTVLHTIDINDITDRNAAVAKLKSRLENKYFWGATTHNCAEFAATIIQAGGSKYTATCWLPSVMTSEDTRDVGDGGGLYKKLHV
jgi:hypothetical protein